MSAQDGERGSISNSVASQTEGVKRALVIGVSDYQADELKLNYADNDAALFKEYLSTIEQIPDERLSYLVDADAISINIMRELKKLMNESSKGDTVYIFFAGHGDVVDDFGGEEGFLLAADANEHQEYYGTQGVVPLKILNKVIDQVTAKEAKVVLVLDACRSGFLYKEGAQKNLETLNNNFQNSIKFLSCGPNQLSYESDDIKQGFFTHYLVLGLMGAADNMIQDNNIQYFELELFLDNNVKSETNDKQVPVVWNQKATEIFKAVNPEDKRIALEQIKSTSNIKNLLASRGVSNEIFKPVTLNPIIKQFNEALKKEDYNGNSTSAYELYHYALDKGLVGQDIIERMRYSLVSALSANAQLLINDYIGNAENLPNSSVFETKATYLGFCLNLLDKDDFSYNSLLTSKLFLEAYATIRSRNFSNYPIAKQKLKQALKIEERAAYIHNALGIILNHEEKYDEASFHYNRAKELIPSWSFPVNNLGTNYYETYHYSQANAFYLKALEMRGSNRTALNNLGAISKSQGKYHEAEQYYHKVNEISGGYSSTTLRNLGLLYKDRGNIKKAIEWFQKALEKDPTDVYTYYSYSAILNEHNIDAKRSEGFLKKAIQLEPYFSNGHAKYADLLRRYPRNEDSYKQADSLYDFAIKNDPYYEWSYAGRGWLYHKLKDKAKALASFEAGIKANPLNAKSYYYLAGYYNTGIKEKAKAVNYYKRAIEKDSFYLPAYRGLVNLYNGQDEEHKALTLLKEVIQWNTDAPDIWNLLGDTHFNLSDFVSAAEAYKKTITVDSTYAKGHSNLGYSQLQLGQYEAAVENFKLAVRFNPFQNNLEDYANLVLTEARKQNRKKELESTRTLLKLAYEMHENNKTAFALAEHYYLNGLSQLSKDIVSEYMKASVAKTWRIKMIELATKVEIDLKNKNKAAVFLEQLKEINPVPNVILEALILQIKGNKKLALEAIKTVNPLLLSTKYLKNKYSQGTILLIKNLSE